MFARFAVEMVTWGVTDVRERDAAVCASDVERCPRVTAFAVGAYFWTGLHMPIDGRIVGLPICKHPNVVLVLWLVSKIC